MKGEEKVIRLALCTFGCLAMAVHLAVLPGCGEGGSSDDSPTAEASSGRSGECLPLFPEGTVVHHAEVCRGETTVLLQSTWEGGVWGVLGPDFTPIAVRKIQGVGTLSRNGKLVLNAMQVAGPRVHAFPGLEPVGEGTWPEGRMGSVEQPMSYVVPRGEEGWVIVPWTNEKPPLLVDARGNASESPWKPRIADVRRVAVDSISGRAYIVGDRNKVEVCDLAGPGTLDLFDLGAETIGYGATFGAGLLWVCTEDGSVLAIDVSARKVSKKLTFAGEGPEGKRVVRLGSSASGESVVVVHYPEGVRPPGPATAHLFSGTDLKERTETLALRSYINHMLFLEGDRSLLAFGQEVTRWKLSK